MQQVQALLLQVPVFLEDKWYFYHLFLVAVFAVFFLVNIFLKKRTPRQQAIRNLKSAVFILKKTTTAPTRKNRLKLASGKNLVRAVASYLDSSIRNNDLYELSSTLDSIKQVEAKISLLINNIEKAIPQNQSQIDEILESITGLNI